MNFKIIQDNKGNPAILFTPKNFGVIFTDDELREFLNIKLANLATLIGILPIDEQKVK